MGIPHSVPDFRSVECTSPTEYGMDGIGSEKRFCDLYERNARQRDTGIEFDNNTSKKPFIQTSGFFVQTRKIFTG